MPTIEEYIAMAAELAHCREHLEHCVPALAAAEAKLAEWAGVVDPPPVDDPPPPTDELRVQTLMIHSQRIDNGNHIVIEDKPPTDTAQEETGILVHSGGEWLATGMLAESENPDGNRGHCMVMGTGKAELTDCTFVNFGRTTTAPLSATNIIGRYIVHNHKPTTSSEPYFANPTLVVNGGLYKGSPKWGIVLHQRHFCTIQGATVEDCVGAGIVCEDGDEYGNEIIGNTIRGSRGNGAPADAPGRAASDFGSEGAGIWLAGPWNTVDGNTIEDCNIGTQMFLSGANGKGRRLQVKLPLRRGANMQNPADARTVDLRDVGTFTQFPVKPITNSVIRRCNIAHEWWDVAGSHVMVKGSDIAECGIAFKSQFTKDPQIEDCVCDVGTLLVHNAGYLNSVQLRRVKAKCSKVGLNLLEGVRGVVLEDCEFDSPVAISYQHMPQFQTYFLSRRTTYTGKRIVSSPPAWEGFRNRAEWSFFGAPFRFVFEDEGFEFYFNEQHPDYVAPTSGKNFAGSPEAGLTNRQLFEKYGFSTFGYLMPDDAETHPDLPGGKISRTVRPFGGVSLKRGLGEKRIDSNTIEMRWNSSAPVKPLFVLRWNTGVSWTYHQVDDQPFATNVTFQARVPVGGALSVLFKANSGELLWCPVFVGI